MVVLWDKLIWQSAGNYCCFLLYSSFCSSLEHFFFFQWIIYSIISDLIFKLLAQSAHSSDMHGKGSVLSELFSYTGNCGKIIFPLGMFKEKSQNNRMAWLGRNPEDHLIPTLLLWAQLLISRPGRPGLHPNVALNAYMNEASTASLIVSNKTSQTLANCFQCLITIWVKHFLLTLSLSTCIKSCSPFLYKSPLSTEWLQWCLPGTFSKLNNPNFLSLSS